MHHDINSRHFLSWDISISMAPIVMFKLHWVIRFCPLPTVHCGGSALWPLILSPLRCTIFNFTLSLHHPTTYLHRDRRTSLFACLSICSIILPLFFVFLPQLFLIISVFIPLPSFAHPLRIPSSPLTLISPPPTTHSLKLLSHHTNTRILTTRLPP